MKMGVWCPRDIAWATGVFEGEGCISMSQSGSRPKVRLTLGMCDLDIVARVQSVFGGAGSLREHHGTEHDAGVAAGTRKRQWKWDVCAFEHVQAILAMMWPYLGARRRAKARELLKIQVARIQGGQRRTWRIAPSISAPNHSEAVRAALNI